MFKIALCDDNHTYIQYLKQIIHSVAKNDIIVEFYEYLSGEELIRHLDVQYDAVFLDIQMGKMDGNETAKELRSINKNTILVFCTGVQMPTPDSFKVQPYRYLLKQYGPARMKSEIIEIMNELKYRSAMPYIYGMRKNEKIKVLADDILYISVVKRGSEIWVNHDVFEYKIEGTLFIAEKLIVLYEHLKNYGFEYAHNSYIVNLKYIAKISGISVELIDGTVLNVARSKSKNFREQFTHFLGNKYKR